MNHVRLAVGFGFHCGFFSFNLFGFITDIAIIRTARTLIEKSGIKWSIKSKTRKKRKKGVLAIAIFTWAE